MIKDDFLTLLFFFVPNLRFDYHDIWGEIFLQDICGFFKGNGISKEDISDNGNPCILYGQLYTTYKNEIINEVISKTNVDLKNPFYSKKNDLIIPSSGEDSLDIAVARSIKQENILLGGDLNVLRPNKEVSSDFLSYQLNGVRKYDIARIAQGKSIVHLHNDDLKKIKVFLPHIEEQKKISYFLSLLDLRIETQIKIIEDYIALRKQIVENELTIQSSEYNEYKLSNILKEVKNYSVKNGSIPHATLSKEGIYEKSERYDRDFLVKSDDKAYKISKYNDICYNPANLKFGVITINKFGDCIFSPIYVTFKVKEPFDPDYVALYLCRDSFIKKARKYEQGTVYERTAVSPEDLLSIKVLMPNLIKQRECVHKIELINAKIKNEERVLSSLKMQKSYLLNNLFI